MAIAGLGSFSGITQWIRLTTPSAPAHTTYRIGL